MDIAFVLHFAIRGDIAHAVMGIHVIGTHANRFWGCAKFSAIEFGHDIFANHTPGFAHIDLMRPVVCIDEFIFSESPFFHFITNFCRNARVITDAPHQALLILFMISDDFFAFFVGGFRVFVIGTNVIGADREIIIGIGFAIGHHENAGRNSKISSFEVTEQKFEVFFVVILGFREGRPVFRNQAHTHTEAICLKSMIFGTIFWVRASFNSRKQATFRVARYYIGIYLGGKAMVMIVFLFLNAIKSFIIFCISFTTHMEGDACNSEKVAFVGCIEEHFTCKGFA